MRYPSSKFAKPTFAVGAPTAAVYLANTESVRASPRAIPEAQALSVKTKRCVDELRSHRRPALSLFTIATAPRIDVPLARYEVERRAHRALRAPAERTRGEARKAPSFVRCNSGCRRPAL